MNTTGPDMEFRATIELVLFVMGGAMTIGVLIFGIWLLKQMRREEKAREQSGDDERGGA